MPWSHRSHACLSDPLVRPTKPVESWDTTRARRTGFAQLGPALPLLCLATTSTSPLEANPRLSMGRFQQPPVIEVAPVERRHRIMAGHAVLYHQHRPWRPRTLEEERRRAAA